jgi:hypothetical protein
LPERAEANVPAAKDVIRLVVLLAHGDTGDEVDQLAEIWHARKIGRPVEGGPNTLAARDQPTCATRSWAFASAAVAGCAGSCSTIAS